MRAGDDYSTVPATKNSDELKSSLIGTRLSGKTKKVDRRSNKSPQNRDNLKMEKAPRIRVELSNQFSLPINILAGKQFMLAPGESRTLSLAPDIVIEYSVAGASQNNGLPTIPAEPNIRTLTPLGSEGESRRIIDFRPRPDSPGELYIDEKKVKTGKQPDPQEK